MNAITKRIREETRRYAGEVGGGVRLAGVYSFGIEMGLAIAVQAGPRAARLLEELRADVYHGEADRWVIDQADREAAAIAGGRLS